MNSYQSNGSLPCHTVLAGFGYSYDEIEFETIDWNNNQIGGSL